MAEPVFHPLGDDILSVAVPDAATAQALAERLRDKGFGEVVPGLASLAIQYDPLTHHAACVETAIRAAWASLPGRVTSEAAILTIPIRYGGEEGADFAAVCEELGMSAAGFIAWHTGQDFPVEMIGFTPGFAYVGGAGDHAVSRLKEPRARVPAGSVGLAGGYTGLYALEGPGGWPLIGRTTLSLFDAQAEEPFRLHGGMRVRFEAVP